MSDAISETYRDNLRATAVNRYLSALTDWLEEPGEARMTALRQAADRADKLGGGYFSHRTSLSGKLEGLCRDLAAGERKSWAALLSSLSGLDYRTENRDIRRRLRDLSPFKGKVLLKAKYGDGFVSFQGDFTACVDRRVAEEGGSPYRGKDYVLLLPAELLAQAEVVEL